MSALLAILLGVVLVPLCVASWRLSLAGLTAQGLLMACIAVAGMHEPPGWPEALRLLDLCVVRGLAAPVALGWVLRHHRTPARCDLIPPNVLWWSVVLWTTLASLDLAEVLVPQPGTEQLAVAVAIVQAAVAFMILSSQSAVFAQMVAAYHLENAVSLLELGDAAHPSGTAVALQAGVMVATVVAFGWFLSLAHRTTTEAPEDAPGATPL